MKYSLIDNAIQLRHAAKYFKRFISQARQSYELVVIDCNPSSSFVTKCALESSTHVISPVKLDKFSILGVGIVNDLFDYLDLTPTHSILINGIKRCDPMSQLEIELRGHAKYGARVLANRLVQSTLLSADPSYTGFATDRKVAYSGILRTEINKLVDEIGQSLGIK